MASMASLIMSAAEPWMTLLTAVRSGRVERAAAGVVGEERELVDGADALDRAAAAEDRGDVALAAAFVERVGP